MGKNFYSVRCSLILITIFTFYSALAFAQQREYNFNAPGSKCYFRYLSFTADSDYSMIKRPFIFILGEETQTAADLFESDTLKNSSAFTNYYFVYLPGIINGSGQKLECIEALVSLLTYNYKYGKSNLFLQVNDTTIKWDDINTYRLRAVFKSIRLQGEEEYLTVNKSETGSIQEDFRESASSF